MSFLIPPQGLEPKRLRASLVDRTAIMVLTSCWIFQALVPSGRNTGWTPGGFLGGLQMGDGAVALCIVLAAQRVARPRLGVTRVFGAVFGLALLWSLFAGLSRWLGSDLFGSGADRFLFQHRGEAFGAVAGIYVCLSTALGHAVAPRANMLSQIERGLAISLLAIFLGLVLAQVLSSRTEFESSDVLRWLLVLLRGAVVALCGVFGATLLVVGSRATRSDPDRG